MNSFLLDISTENSVGMSLAESLGEITGLLLVFAFILFLAWISTRFIAKRSSGEKQGANIQVVETYKLAPNRYIQIVRVAGHYLAIAVSKDEITMLTELTEGEISFPDYGQSVTIPFMEVLKKRLGSERNKSK